MPVIIPPESWPAWLGEELGDLAAMLGPSSADQLEAWPVAVAVGNVRNNGLELLQPIWGA